MASSIVRRLFENDIPAWFQRKSKVGRTPDAALQPLDGHSGAVNSVAFSPDGKVVASASNDCTIRFWESATGAALQTL